MGKRETIRKERERKRGGLVRRVSRRAGRPLTKPGMLFDPQDLHGEGKKQLLQAVL